jgi:hypothetical protein
MELAVPFPGQILSHLLFVQVLRRKISEEYKSKSFSSLSALMLATLFVRRVKFAV